jgi:hypothetical protein
MSVSLSSTTNEVAQGVIDGKSDPPDSRDIIGQPIGSEADCLPTFSPELPTLRTRGKKEPKLLGFGMFNNANTPNQKKKKSEKSTF